MQTGPAAQAAVAEKPFMAQDVDAFGQAYYGTGFKGWARGTFARVFDPKNFIQNIKDAEFVKQADEQSDDYARGIEKLTRWDEWGENLFGISSKQLGQSLSAMQAERAYGKAKGEDFGTSVSAIAGMFTRSVKEMGMTALGAFGVMDYMNRKNIMSRQAQYELVQQADLYNAAKEAGVGEWLLGRGPTWEREGVPNGGFLAENPIVGKLADPLRPIRDAFVQISILTDKDTRGKYVSTVKKYWQGSGMAYTMVSDAAKRAEFIERINAGDDPGLVAVELGNVWTEVGGSIFNDPTTYMGVGIYGKGSSVVRIPFSSKALTIAGKPLRVPWQKIANTPTFGELLGVGLKATRTRGAAKFASAIPAAADEVARMDEVAKQAGGWERIADEAEAFASVKAMGSNLLETVKQWDLNLTAGKLPSARTMTSSSVKASQFYRNAHDALGLVISGGGTIDDRLESLNNLRKMHTGTDAERAEAVALAVKEHGQLAMSDSFLQLGKFLSHFEGDEAIAKLIAKTDEDPAAIFGELAPRLQKFAEQFYPSMDEMADAAATLASKGDDVKRALSQIDDLKTRVTELTPPQLLEGPAAAGKTVKSKDLIEAEKALSKAQKAFDNQYGKIQDMANAYEQINPLARTGRKMLRTYEKTFFRPAKKYMDTVFLALRPAQYMKQLQSQTALIAMDLGFLDAVEIFARTAASSFSEGWTAKILKANSDEITKILGFAPEAMSRGVTAAGEAKGAGFLRVSGNLDTLMSSEIVLRTARREMDKILKNGPGIFDLKRLEGVFGKDELGLLNRLVTETGDVKEAISQFAKIAKKGNFEAWRYLPMPDTLKDFAQQNKLYDGLLTLQKTAKTRDEFVKGIQDVIERATAQARRAAAADPPVVDEQTHEVIRQSFLEAQDLASKGLLTEAETKIFNNTVNAYEYMRRNIEAGSKAFRNAVDLIAAQAGSIASPEYQSVLQTLDDATGMIHDMYPKYDETARLVREVLHDGKGLPSLDRAQLLDNARFDIPQFTGYTIDELGTLDPKEFEKVVWSAYFEFGRQYWKQTNTEVLARTVESLEAMAETAGTTVEDVIARSSTVREYLFNARKYQQQAMIWENNAKYFSKNLSQIAQAYGIPTASSKGMPLNRNLLKIINDNLPPGVQPFADLKEAQARIDDARVALAQWANKKAPDPAVQAMGKIDEFLGQTPSPTSAQTGPSAAAAGPDLAQTGPAAPTSTQTPPAAPASAQPPSPTAAAPGSTAAAAAGPDLTEEAVKIPRSDLPDEVSNEFARVADELRDELFTGQAGHRQVTDVMEGGAVTSKWSGVSSTNEQWYRDLYAQGLRKPAVDKAIEKIIKDKGADKGATVERVKEVILNRIRWGDDKKGIPPNLRVLQALGASPDELEAALDTFNDITRGNYTLEDAMRVNAPETAEVEELLDFTEGVPHFDDAGNLITPNIDEIPPVVQPGTATGAQAMHENLTSPNFLTDVQAWADSVSDNWGSLKETTQLDGAKRIALEEWSREASKRMKTIKAKVTKVATMQRDDLLLTYDKNYGDLALAYFKPYHYWQTRQYAKTFGKFLDHPSWANGYLKYKEAMSRENADLPEWWRYNIAIQDLPGIHLKHPIYVNLESAINPIYDLTGTDFNDPYRRVDWLSRTVDDLGKTGGTFMPPIQWMIGLNLYRKGENDAAQRWMGRILGQTGQAIKSGLTAAGVDINIGNFIQHNEIDPFVNFLMGGMDPNERKRIGRQIAGMIEDGVPAEEALEAMYSQSGDLYEEARRQSVLARSPAELKSFFLGVNWKPRTQQDAEIDTFYQEYYQLRAQAEMMPPEDYRRAWDLLRDKYEFMDSVLLSGKNTPDREAAYTYNVFGRVPPGQASQLYKAAGIDSKLAQLFFDTKGELTGISSSDKARFMAGVADLGAMLQIPDYATKQDWNTARDEYKDIQEQMSIWFGDEIAEEIDYYYSLDEKKKEAFAQNNPKVKAAIEWQNMQLINNPEVYEYYGGINSLERFHKGKVYAQLETEFGAGIEETWSQYYDMQMYDPKGAKQFKKAHPELTAYTARKSELMDQALRSIVEFATVLPEADIPPQLTGREPVSVGQEAIFEYANQPPTPTFEDWTQQLPTETQLIAAYWNGEIKLPAAVKNSLDYKARDYGFSSGDDLLQAILISLNKGP